MAENNDDKLEVIGEETMTSIRDQHYNVVPKSEHKIEAQVRLFWLENAFFEAWSFLFQTEKASKVKDQNSEHFQSKLKIQLTQITLHLVFYLLFIIFDLYTALNHLQ